MNSDNDGRDEVICSICLLQFTTGDEVRNLQCKHFFHTACVDSWLVGEPSCPLCHTECRPEPLSSSSRGNTSVLARAVRVLRGDERETTEQERNEESGLEMNYSMYLLWNSHKKKLRMAMQPFQGSHQESKAVSCRMRGGHDILDEVAVGMAMRQNLFIRRTVIHSLFRDLLVHHRLCFPGTLRHCTGTATPRCGGTPRRRCTAGGAS